MLISCLQCAGSNIQKSYFSGIYIIKSLCLEELGELLISNAYKSHTPKPPT